MGLTRPWNGLATVEGRSQPLQGRAGWDQPKRPQKANPYHYRTTMNIRTRFMPFVCTLVLALSTLLVTPAADAKDAVTRPFYISGEISFLDFSDEGTATHFGRFASVADDASAATGKYYTANGDLVYWNAVSFDFVTLTGVIEFTGGTGRFLGATGGYTYTFVPLDASFTIFSYTGKGTITY